VTLNKATKWLLLVTYKSLVSTCRMTNSLCYVHHKPVHKHLGLHPPACDDQSRWPCTVTLVDVLDMSLKSCKLANWFNTLWTFVQFLSLVHVRDMSCQSFLLAVKIRRFSTLDIDHESIGGCSSPSSRPCQGCTYTYSLHFHSFLSREVTHWASCKQLSAVVCLKDHRQRIPKKLL